MIANFTVKRCGAIVRFAVVRFIITWCDVIPKHNVILCCDMIVTYTVEKSRAVARLAVELYRALAP